MSEYIPFLKGLLENNYKPYPEDMNDPPHWIKIDPTRKKSNKYKCSQCQGICYTSQWWDSCHYKFCPNCGKEMMNNGNDNNT